MGCAKRHRPMRGAAHSRPLDTCTIGMVYIDCALQLFTVVVRSEAQRLSVTVALKRAQCILPLWRVTRGQPAVLVA